MYSFKATLLTSVYVACVSAAALPAPGSEALSAPQPPPICPPGTVGVNLLCFARYAMTELEPL